MASTSIPLTVLPFPNTPTPTLPGTTVPPGTVTSTASSAVSIVATGNHNTTVTNAGPGTNINSSLPASATCNTATANNQPSKSRQRWLKIRQPCIHLLTWSPGAVIMYLLFDLSMWSAAKDYRDDCRNENETYGHISKACTDALHAVLSRPFGLSMFISTPEEDERQMVRRTHASGPAPEHHVLHPFTELVMLIIACLGICLTGAVLGYQYAQRSVRYSSIRHTSGLCVVPLPGDTNNTWVESCVARQYQVSYTASLEVHESMLRHRPYHSSALVPTLEYIKETNSSLTEVPVLLSKIEQSSHVSPISEKPLPSSGYHPSTEPQTRTLEHTPDIEEEQLPSTYDDNEVAIAHNPMDWLADLTHLYFMSNEESLPTYSDINLENAEKPTVDYARMPHRKQYLAQRRLALEKYLDTWQNGAWPSTTPGADFEQALPFAERQTDSIVRYLHGVPSDNLGICTDSFADLWYFRKHLKDTYGVDLPVTAGRASVILSDEDSVLNTVGSGDMSEAVSAPSGKKVLHLPSTSEASEIAHTLWSVE